jgi:hypothetical protein
MKKSDNTQIFKVAGADGATTIAGGGLTVDAGGATVTAGGLTVSADGAAITGNSTVAGTLGVTGDTTIDSGGLRLIDSGNDYERFNVDDSAYNLVMKKSDNTQIFKVAGADGATTIADTLDVTGLATLGGGATIPTGKTLTVTDTAAMLNGGVSAAGLFDVLSDGANGADMSLLKTVGGATAFDIDGSSGNTGVFGSLAIAGQAHMYNTLTVTGSTTIAGGLGLQGVARGNACSIMGVKEDYIYSNTASNVAVVSLEGSADRVVLIEIQFIPTASGDQTYAFYGKYLFVEGTLTPVTMLEGNNAAVTPTVTSDSGTWSGDEMTVTLANGADDISGILVYTVWSKHLKSVALS